MRKISMSLAIAVLVISAIALPSLADTSTGAQVQQEVQQQTCLQAQAEEQQSQVQVQQYLQARYDMVSARVEFTNGVMTDLADLIPEASFLKEYIDLLDSDLAELHTYVDACDVRGFNRYVSGPLAQDYNDAQQAIRRVYSNFTEWGLSTENKNQLREKYQERLEAYKGEVQGVVIIKPDRNALISASANADARNTQGNALRAASAAGLTSASGNGEVKSTGAQLNGNAKGQVRMANASACVSCSPVPATMCVNA